MMKKTMKRTMKKADGGDVKTTAVKGKPDMSQRPAPPIAGFPGRGQSLKTAMENANANARFNRPATMPPATPVRPTLPTQANPMARSAVAGAMPMRRAKGGMADGGKWIQGAIKKPGALRSALGAKKGEPIPMGKLEKATHSKNPKMAKRANLAMTLRGMKKK